MEAVDIHKDKKKKSFSPTRRIAFSFFMVILIGSILLCFSFSNNGTVIPYLDHLFIATSATCVTGLVPIVVSEQYSLIGQLIILALIQIGGLGFLTLLNMMLIAFKKKLSYTNKLIMQEALNQSSMRAIAIYIKRVIKYTAVIELTGALLLSFVFIPQFGFAKGIYYSIFHAISAFCNAGFDILGSQSLIGYQGNVLVNLVIAGLIISGGLGFIVWVDLRTSWHKYKENFKVFQLKRYISALSVHTKIVLIMTTFLIVSGMMIILALEFDNPATLGPLDWPQKVLASFFQSTTLRTAGFATVDMASLHVSTKLLMSMFMFIGGSPAGTAGGIKTVTVAIMLLYIFALIKGSDTVKVMKRSIADQVVKRSLTIAMVSFFITISGLFVLSITEEALPFIDLTFEAFSAFATVGLSASITPLLTSVGKVIIIILMYIGRIGPITMVLMFAKRYSQMKGKDISYPQSDVLIG